MRVISSTILLALASTPAWAFQPPQAPAQQADPTHEITVTGVRPETYRQRLAACLARHCPPNEDADATLALAEALFLNGGYEEGRSAVGASLARNRPFVRQFPEAVSDLHRAYARLSRHLGYDDQAARSTNEILRSLQAGIPREDYRHFTARLEIAELAMAMGYAARAERELRELERVAHDAGREDVVTIARLRGLWFDYIADPQGDAKRRLTALAAATDPSHRMEASGAKLLLARIYRGEGDTRRADALLAEVGQGSSVHRRLISAPTYQLQMQERRNAMELTDDLATIVALGNTINRMPDNFRDKWIDVGFWIMPDGHVDGVEIQRSGGEAHWADPLIESIRGRIYSTATEPTYRLERYTYTSRYERATESRMVQHTPQARLEYLDLTGNAPPPAPPPAGSLNPGSPAR
jgi:hypothetical protein